MITLKSTNNDGVIKEMTFSSEREAANALRDLFGTDALKSESQRIRDVTNSELRRAYRSKEVDPSVFFRRGDNQTD